MKRSFMFMKVQLPDFSFCDTLQNVYFPDVYFLSCLFYLFLSGLYYPGLCHDPFCYQTSYPCYTGHYADGTVCHNAGCDQDGTDDRIYQGGGSDDQGYRIYPDTIYRHQNVHSIVRYYIPIDYASNGLRNASKHVTGGNRDN